MAMTDQIKTPELANRFARAIASDIVLYNDDKIVKGIESDTLFQAIQAEIREGEMLYKSRVAKEILEADNFFERALVDVIFKQRGETISSSIW